MGDSEVAGEIASGFAGAWNEHDMSALGQVFHHDATFVNVIGTCMRGREDIERGHGVAHAGRTGTPRCARRCWTRGRLFLT